VALKTGWAGPKEFTPSSFDNSEILNLAKRVGLKEDPTLFLQFFPKSANMFYLEL